MLPPGSVPTRQRPKWLRIWGDLHSSIFSVILLSRTNREPWITFSRWNGRAFTASGFSMPCHLVPFYVMSCLTTPSSKASDTKRNVIASFSDDAVMLALHHLADNCLQFQIYPLLFVHLVIVLGFWAVAPKTWLPMVPPHMLYHFYL